MKHLRVFTRIYFVEDFHYTNLKSSDSPLSHLFPTAERVRLYELKYPDGKTENLLSVGYFPDADTATVSRLVSLMEELKSKYDYSFSIIDFMDFSHKKLIIRLTNTHLLEAKE